MALIENKAAAAGQNKSGKSDKVNKIRVVGFNMC